MNKSILLILTILTAASAPALAGPRSGAVGRTVCLMGRSTPSYGRVIRAVPVSQPVVKLHRYYGNGDYAGYSYLSHGQDHGYGYGRACGYAGYARPDNRHLYGYGYGRPYHVGNGNMGNACRPNGYVGGLSNLPSNVIRIPAGAGGAAGSCAK